MYDNVLVLGAIPGLDPDVFWMDQVEIYRSGTGAPSPLAFRSTPIIR